MRNEGVILIRADANEKIGIGHIMRCLSIANAFSRIGLDVLFVTADNNGDNIIHSHKYQSVCLNSDWKKFEFTDIENVIAKYNPSLVLTDSYYITYSYFKNTSLKTKTAYIDDINAGVWDVDYLINYNITGINMDYSSYINTRTELLLGTEYVPLRDEFSDLPEHAIKEVKDIMVSAGGSDPEGITVKILEYICSRYKDIVFHIIVGALNPQSEKMMSMNLPNVVFHINERNMANVMSKCDIAISAAGSTLYELCACGTPTITYTMADNQLLGANEFESNGIMINAGDCRNNDQFINRLDAELNALLCDKDKRNRLSIAMSKLVDGHGAMRIAEKLMI